MKEYKGGLLWGDGFFSRRNVSYPFAKLIIWPDHLILESLDSEFRVERSEVTGISTKNRIIYKGVVIKHSNKDNPKLLVFWTFQSSDVLADLDKFMLK